MKIGQSF